MRTLSDIAWTTYDFAVLPVSAVISIGTGEVERTLDIMDDLQVRIERVSESIRHNRECRKEEIENAAAEELHDTSV